MAQFKSKDKVNKHLTRMNGGCKYFFGIESVRNPADGEAVCEG
jgi:hypothetical protein